MSGRCLQVKREILETCTLSNTDDGIVRLLQISDTHLFADASRDLLGIPTAASFQAVLHAITELPQPVQEFHPVWN
jgi:Icc protein